MSPPSSDRFLLSDLTAKGSLYKEDDFWKWFNNKSSYCFYSIKEIPFSELNDWYFDEVSGNLAHSSGKFFSIHGISVTTNLPQKRSWSQPVISQPEIGLLGIITKSFNGVPHFLMQAKMEPGNINIVQLSPTVQATKSNYSRVHKGKLPLYFEFFKEKPLGRIIVDQLQSEQGARYINKLNRNIIIEIEEDVEIHENYCWLTLGQIKKLLHFNNIVNMDSRTVLSNLQYINNKDYTDSVQKSRPSDACGKKLGRFQESLFRSMLNGTKGLHNMEDIISWFTNLKATSDITVKNIPLNRVDKWYKNDYEIHHESRHHFSVIAVSVEAEDREVPSWNQPILKHFSYGIVGFLAGVINGVLHFLVEARMSPGYRDFIEMGPTVSCGEAHYCMETQNIPPFLEYFYNADKKNIRFSSILSEEGGRFYHFQNRYMIIETESPEEINIPYNYIWMTLGQLLSLIKHSGYINIEARSLISCLSFQ